MRLITVAVVALLVCASVAPTAMALGDSTVERQGSAVSVTSADRAGTVLQTGGTNESTTTATSQSNDSNGSDTALGLRVSSFVQSTSSETAGVVDSGMWAADVVRSNRPDAVDQQVTRIRDRVSTLRTERAELRDAYQSGEISRLQYRSKLAELNGRFVALSVATEDTERVATQLNARAPGLQRVREEIDAERRAGGPGFGRPAAVGLTNTSEGNESTTDGPAPRRGNGDESRGNDNRGNGDGNRGNGDGAAADSVRVDGTETAFPPEV